MGVINLKLFSERLKECRENLGLSVRELGANVGLSEATISRYENTIHGPGRDAIANLSEILNVDPAWLMGANVDKYLDYTIKGKRIPIVGIIAAGLPILAEENILGFEFIPDNVHADFCLKVKGDSMINARILDGDLVYIRQQSDVETGEIAAILIDRDTATLKRVYKINGTVVLRSENPNFPDQIYTKKDIKEVRILGKAILFQSEVR